MRDEQVASDGLSMAPQHLPIEGTPREEIHFLHLTDTPSATEALLAGSSTVAVGQARVSLEAQPAPSSLEQPVEQLPRNRVRVVAHVDTLEQIKG